MYILQKCPYYSDKDYDVYSELLLHHIFLIGSQKSKLIVYEDVDIPI